MVSDEEVIVAVFRRVKSEWPFRGGDTRSPGSRVTWTDGGDDCGVQGSAGRR
jgi:hypothetical protein